MCVLYDNKIVRQQDKKTRKAKTKQFVTEASTVVPHQSTSSAQTGLNGIEMIYDIYEPQQHKPKCRTHHTTSKQPESEPPTSCPTNNNLLPP